MVSRLTSEDFMPEWPIAMPSVTVMVTNSRGVPPAALTPRLAISAWPFSAVLQGADSFQLDTTPTNGLAMSCSVRPMA